MGQLATIAVEQLGDWIGELVKLAEHNAVAQSFQYMRLSYGDRQVMKHLVPVMSYPWGVDEDTPNASPEVLHQNKKGGYYFKAYDLKLWIENQELPEEDREPVLRTYSLDKVHAIQPNTIKGISTVRWNVETSKYNAFQES